MNITAHNSELPIRLNTASVFDTLVLVTILAIARIRAYGNVSFGHSPTTNVGNSPRYTQGRKGAHQDLGIVEY